MLSQALKTSGSASLAAAATFAEASSPTGDNIGPGLDGFHVPMNMPKNALQSFRRYGGMGMSAGNLVRATTSANKNSCICSDVW